MEVGNDVRAESSLARATQLAPGEPAGWANRGILALRQRNFDDAKRWLNRAHQLAPHNSQIDADLGELESAQGDSAAAIADFREAISRDPRNVRTKYQLALEVERLGGSDSAAEFQSLMEEILSAEPDNLPALLELSRIVSKRGDAATLRSAVARIAAQSGTWPAMARQQLVELQRVAASAPATAALQSIFLRNVLMQDPQFRQSLAVIKAQPGQEAEPFLNFVLLPSPESRPATADAAMSFIGKELPNAKGQKWDWIGAFPLTEQQPPTLTMANGKLVQQIGGPAIQFPGGANNLAPGPESVVPVDFNYDFKTDLVLAGAGGVRLMRQDSAQKFTDVSTQTKLPAAILDGDYTGAWAIDVEADGDLDILLGSPSGPPVVLRNNGDGTFLPIHPFRGVSGVQQFVWADLDGDGNPDVSLIDGAGQLHVFRNERGANFAEIATPKNLGSVKAIAAADTQDNGVLDLLAIEAGGAIVQLTSKDGAMTAAEITRVPDPEKTLNGPVRLLTPDLDNNGAVDLVLAQVGPPQANHGAMIWLGGDHGEFTRMNRDAGPSRVLTATDVSGSGRLDLLGLDNDGQPVVAVNHGMKDYRWQVVRTRAVQATGDQRINPFGVGGQVQIRSGLLLQTRVITGPAEHFGLGTWTETDVARIVWPNGVVNAEFSLKADQEVLAEQRLKGSCPFLFAWDGKEMRFVKDTAPWGSAIGLRIDALGSERIAATQEWFKIPRSALMARDGMYDLRITGELWETYYYDWLELMTVDHPAGTEIFTDERFVVPPVKLAITETNATHPIARAVDDRGNDVTDIVRSLDGRYLDTFGRGQYQGVTRDHYVEIDLGDDVPMSGPLYLIARGWLHPSDSTVNEALGQGRQRSKPLRLEIPDGHGGWVVVRPNLGFPAGRNKICLINLTGIFQRGMPRKVRLGTNLEIYWDQIQWASGVPDAALKITRIEPSTANLRYRGYSVIHQANQSSPEIPDYNRLMSTTQIWPDLEGYYTRYGDVRQLLRKVDDRYVIMNAGDEIVLRFAEPAPPRPGWVRDYVIAGDGWIKDGDYNSTNSATVCPLPYHARSEYDTPPGPLENEWVYRRHSDDWLTWQTRYVTPEHFRKALNDEPGKTEEAPRRQ